MSSCFGLYGQLTLQIRDGLDDLTLPAFQLFQLADDRLELCLESMITCSLFSLMVMSDLFLMMFPTSSSILKGYGLKVGTQPDSSSLDDMMIRSMELP